MDNTHQLFSTKSPVLIIGKNGTLGRAFARICHDRNIPYVLVGRTDCDIVQRQQLEEIINRYKPWAIVNTAGFVRIDDAEVEAERCYQDNVEGPKNLAILCQQQGIKLLSFSSDHVFDGNKSKPYLESDLINPLNTYGSSKARCEEEVFALNPTALIIRTSTLFGPWDECNFLHYVMDNLSKQQQITVADDIVVSPTYIPDLVHVALDLMIDDEKGIWHLANKGSISWAELAFQTASAANLNNIFINAVPASELQQKALRPKYSVLGSEKGIILPRFENAFRRFFNEKETSIAVKSII